MQLTGRFSGKRDFFPFDEYITLKAQKGRCYYDSGTPFLVNRNDCLSLRKGVIT